MPGLGGCSALCACLPASSAAAARPQIWKCSQDESNHKVHEFFTSTHFAEGIEVIPGARSGVLGSWAVSLASGLASHCHTQQPAMVRPGEVGEGRKLAK